jgi:hypothetical protein
MATSFISEHSSEYILVAKLAGMMKPYFERVIPLFFLSTREGSSISRQCNPSQVVKIISVFARRPKIMAPNQPHIEVKFNESLFEIAQLSSPLGISTFAGVPLASTVMDLSLQTECARFQLTGGASDVTYDVSLDGEILPPTQKSPAVEGPLREIELVERVLLGGRPIRWAEAVENMRTIRRGKESYESMWYRLGGGYHPFHLILFGLKNSTPDSVS